MAKKSERKFFVQLSSGDKFEISELDYNNIDGRVARGASNGWYFQRGLAMGERHEYRFQFKDLAGFWADSDAPNVKKTANIDIDKRVPPEVGKPESEKAENCPHNWNDPDSFIYVTQMVNGLNRYYKQCVKCGAKSQLIKKREVELVMESKGLSLNDVELVQ